MRTGQIQLYTFGTILGICLFIRACSSQYIRGPSDERYNSDAKLRRLIEMSLGDLQKDQALRSAENGHVGANFGRQYSSGLTRGSINLDSRLRQLINMALAQRRLELAGMGRRGTEAGLGRQGKRQSKRCGGGASYGKSPLFQKMNRQRRYGGERQFPNESFGQMLNQARDVSIEQTRRTRKNTQYSPQGRTMSRPRRCGGGASFGVMCKRDPGFIGGASFGGK